MFGPVLWLVASSFKTQAGLVKYPPPLLPYQQVQVEVEGFDEAAAAFHRGYGRWQFPRAGADTARRH